MWKWLARYSSLKTFYLLAGRWLPWLWAAAILLLVTGTVWGLVFAPPDYQQKDSYRIIFIHVPAAWMSLFIYMVMAISGAMALIWKTKLSEVIANSCAPVGAAFTFLTLVTGSLWGKPMWGTWWAWDARLTSELILLFLYLGYMGLQAAIEDRRTAARASAILAVVGVINIPIIHYSVHWWFTLHQGPTVSKFGMPSMHPSMLYPLLIMALAFTVFFVAVMFMRARNEILERESNATWPQEIRESL